MAARATRDAIVSAADRLFHERGFEHTSFADVANEVGISRGNFYYHFKTKDQILEAVIERRLDERQVMLDRWAAEAATPRDRIADFIRILLVNQAEIRRCGCPVGSLFLELTKLGHAGETSARQLFDLFRHWLRRQFEEMGRTLDADDLAMELLARSQGAATLASAYPDEPVLEREVRQMLAWLDAVADD